MPTAALRCENLVKKFAGTTAVARSRPERAGRRDLRAPGGPTARARRPPSGPAWASTSRTAGPSSCSARGIRWPVRHRVGYLPEERGLYAKMKVAEQLTFLAAIRGLDEAEANRRAHAWLDRVGLAANARSETGELSKGMQQKVQFAAAVIHEPDLVVLDEPFTGLDPINSRLLQDLILEPARARRDRCPLDPPDRAGRSPVRVDLPDPRGPADPRRRARRHPDRLRAEHRGRGVRGRRGGR